MRILLVEDDAILRDGLRAGLALHGFTVDAVATGEDARAALGTTAFDAVVLDLMLPDGSGLDVLRERRAEGDATPILLLTARDKVEDRIAGLDTGADDYLGKPFDLDEVAARLRAIARRAQGRLTARLAWNDLVLDTGRRSAFLAGRPIALSRREFAILEALMERPGVILSKSQLEDRLYGWQDDVDSNAVEVHVHHLRGKIGKAAIQTVRGLGYRLQTEGA